MTVTVLHPAPEPHDPECAQGCSAGGRWLAGPCQHQCAKTPEFQEQCERDAEASRLRFRRSLGIGVPREVPPTAGVLASDRQTPTPKHADGGMDGETR